MKLTNLKFLINKEKQQQNKYEHMSYTTSLHRDENDNVMSSFL
jgi:hypothetical protein